MQITTNPLTGLYIGSFDPFTLGHLDIVNQVLGWSLTTYDAKTGKKDGVYPTYGKLIICVGKNDAKTPKFTTEERKKFIELAAAEHPRAEDITVITSDELTVDIARKHNVNYLVRGIRSDADMQNEGALAETNRFLAGQQGFVLNTTFVKQEDEFLKTISSSLVRKLLEMKEYTAAAHCLPPCVARKIIAQELGKVFCEKFSNLLQAQYLWSKIVETYSPRAYHNLMHLAYMFDMLKLYIRHTAPDGIPCEKEMALAIFMHDYVYKTARNHTEPYQNEIASANLVKTWNLVDYLPFYTNRSLISSLIMATTHKDTYMQDLWHMLIADLDLSILGTADFKTYEAYAAGIRKEYAAFSDEEYKKGRLEFLFSLLKRKPLFRTKFFREMLEEQARRNIEKEIKLLHLRS